MLAEAENKFDVTDAIVAFKRAMAPRRAALKRAVPNLANLVHLSDSGWAMMLRAAPARSGERGHAGTRTTL